MSIFSCPPLLFVSLCMCSFINRKYFVCRFWETLWSCGIVINVFFSGWTLKVLENILISVGTTWPIWLRIFLQENMQNINEISLKQMGFFLGPSGQDFRNSESEPWPCVPVTQTTHVTPGVTGGPCLAVPSSQMLLALAHVRQKFQN